LSRSLELLAKAEPWDFIEANHCSLNIFGHLSFDQCNMLSILKVKWRSYFVCITKINMFDLKEIVAISFFLLVTSIQAFPGGYTSANDIVKVQLPRSEWGEAIRAGKINCFVKHLKF